MSPVLEDSIVWMTIPYTQEEFNQAIIKAEKEDGHPRLTYVKI